MTSASAPCCPQVSEASQKGLPYEEPTVQDSSHRGEFCPSYQVTFRFLPRQGEPVRGIANVTTEVWDALEQGGPIAVTYLTDQPQSHRLAGQSKDVALPLLLFGVVGGVVGSIGGFIVFVAVGERKREKALRRSGVVAEATVIEIE